MMYKLLYIEDQNAASIEADLRKQGFDVDVDDSENFDNLLNLIHANTYDAYIFDFRLTAGKGRLDAPSIAQALRTKGDNYKDAPIILISNEKYLKEFDKDLTSQDLFDFAISKEEFRGNLEKYSTRIISFINAYRTIRESSFCLEKVLSLKSEDLGKLIDSRLIEKTKSDIISNDTYAYCRYINISLIRGIGPLIGLDMLLARLGVDKSSKNLPSLLEKLGAFKYKGILSDVYSRWWNDLILEWWNSLSGGLPLRRLNAKERVNLLSEKLHLDLTPIKPLEFTNSSRYWSICMETHHAIDPGEGYIINKKDLAPWQEMEYLSLYAAVNQSKYREFLSSIDKKEIREFEMQK